MNDHTTLIKLIKENKGLICSIINKYTKYYEFDDLYQVSIIGIMKAYKNYREDMNVKFSTYAYKYILSEVLALVNNEKLIKTSKKYQKLYKKIIETRNILTQKLMKEPTIHEISIFLEIDENLINDIIRYQEKAKSLEELIIDEDNNLTLLDKISSEKNNIDIIAITLNEEIKNLSKEEQSLIRMRYFEDKSQTDIANILGTNQVKISRTEQKVLKKLKNKLCQT